MKILFNEEPKISLNSCFEYSYIFKVLPFSVWRDAPTQFDYKIYFNQIEIVNGFTFKSYSYLVLRFKSKYRLRINNVSFWHLFRAKSFQYIYSLGWDIIHIAGYIQMNHR